MALYEDLSVGVLRLKQYTVDTEPKAADYTGCLIYVSDGAAGSPCIAFSDGTNWVRTDDSATAIATS